MCVCACGVCGACGCCGAVLVARSRLEGSGLVSSPWSLCCVILTLSVPARTESENWKGMNFEL